MIPWYAKWEERDTRIPVDAPLRLQLNQATDFESLDAYGSAPTANGLLRDTTVWDRAWQPARTSFPAAHSMLPANQELLAEVLELERPAREKREAAQRAREEEWASWSENERRVRTLWPR